MAELPEPSQKRYWRPATPTRCNGRVALFDARLRGRNKPASVTQAEMLRLNTGIKPAESPNRLGVLAGDNAGFPNGRRLGDDVVDIELQALEGAVTVDASGKATDVTIVQPLANGDLVNANDVAFGSSFPYVALPHSGSTVRPALAAASTPIGTTGTRGSSNPPLVPGLAGGLGILLAGLGVLLFRRERRQVVATP